MMLTVACLASLSAIGLDDPPRVVEGVARIAGTDRPAAGVTLHLFEQFNPAYRVVTDDQGKFRSPTPANLGPGNDGETWTECWAEAEGAGRWTIEASQQPPFHQDPEQIRRAVLESLTRTAKTTWQGGKLVVEYPEPGEAEVLVRGPDGSPLVDRSVQVIEDMVGSHGPASARFVGRTDGSGRFRMRRFEGAHAFRIAVPGLGFGSTRTVELKSGTTTKSETWPLARFGSIAGRVAPRLVAPGLKVNVDPETHAPVDVDAQGRFEIRDLTPGTYFVRLAREEIGQRVPAGHLVVWVTPGQEVEGVVIDEEPPITPEVARRNELELARMNAQVNGKDEAGVWVEGTVKDASGRPLPKADVIVRTGYHGGMRMYEDVRMTTTDADGRYSISGPIHGMVETLVVVASVKGKPPAVANAEARSGRNDRSAKLDLTIADVGGSASIAVLKDGKPLRGASVNLEAEGGADIYAGFGWARGTSGEPKAALAALAWPTAETDGDGVARFANLIPGLYTVHATADAEGQIKLRRGAPIPSDGSAIGTIQGLAVVTGREAKTSIVLAPVKRTVRFQVIRPDGRPLTDQDVSFQFGQRGVINWDTSLTVDGQGFGEHSFDLNGLWNVVVKFRETPTQSFPIAEPYYEATALVTVSPASTTNEPFRLVGLERLPGSLRVRMLDAAGQPARGVINFSNQRNRHGLAASTDARGEVLFANLGRGNYWIDGQIEAQGPPVWSSAGPIPDDPALRGRFVVVPSAEATIDSGRETLLELRARPVGYIKGTLKPPDGVKASEYHVYPVVDGRALRTNWRLDPASGAVVAGPFLAGPATFQYVRYMPDGSPQYSGRQTVEVVAGEVTHADFQPGALESPDRSASRRMTMLGMGGIALNEGAPAINAFTVFLPDGATPAYGAQAAYFEPGQAGPIAQGRSDGSGRLTWRGLWSSGNGVEHDKSRDVDRPTMVVSLPGQLGAAIVPVEEGQAIRVTLPGAIDAEGRVTLAGQASGGGSEILVSAAYQGRGVLNDSLSLEVAAGPDGRFKLAGPTPGRYLVQAARDHIWVSRSVALVVEPGKIPPPLALEIPQPGEPVTLELIDGSGRPFANEVFKINRPDGPFASLWAPLRTDASGRVTLPGLEVGRHTATVEGSSGEVPILVHEPSKEPAPSGARRLILPRSGP